MASKRERGENFGHAAAVKRRADMDKMKGPQRLSFLQYSLDGGCTDERLIFLEGMETERAGLDGGCRFGHGRRGCVVRC